MSEIEESTATTAHDTVRPARNEELAARLLGDRPAVEREGLPRGYRMRADAHYVDQLEARHSGPTVRLIPTRQIDPIEPLTTAAPEALAQSIALHGIVQPLLVRRRNGRYQLIGGRKRLAAAAAAGITEVPCVSYDVDDAQAASLAQADNLRFGDSASSAEADCVHQVLRVVSADFARIGSSTTLLRPTPHKTFQHRFAADFIQAQSWRAAWLAAATAALVRAPKPGRMAAIAAVVERVKAGFEAEARLTHAQIDCAVAPAAAAFAIDDDFGATAIAGCVFATLAWLEGADEPRVEVRVDAPGPRTVKLEVVQRTTVVSPEAARFLREPLRPASGDLTVALALGGATALAMLHGGAAELIAIAGGGSIIQSTFARPSAN